MKADKDVLGLNTSAPNFANGKQATCPVICVGMATCWVARALGSNYPVKAHLFEVGSVLELPLTVVTVRTVFRIPGIFYIRHVKLQNVYFISSSVTYVTSC